VRADIRVGRMIEITASERTQLLHLATEMRALARSAHPGWLLAYADHHKRAHEIFRAIIARSHDSDA